MDIRTYIKGMKTTTETKVEAFGFAGGQIADALVTRRYWYCTVTGAEVRRKTVKVVRL